MVKMANFVILYLKKRSKIETLQNKKYKSLSTSIFVVSLKANFTCLGGKIIVSTSFFVKTQVYVKYTNWENN